MIESIKKDLQEMANPELAKRYEMFYKMEEGSYGESDILLGIPVGEQREIAKKNVGLPLAKIKELLESDIHEHRMTACLILVEKYSLSNDKGTIVDFYIKNAKKFNNWDLVDSTAAKILGNFLLDENRSILYEMSKSKDLWTKRISIVATHAFIRENQFVDTLEISEALLEDDHDLIHKAVGWMLREVGKREIVVLEAFLKKNAGAMPRVMLRYAVEKMTREDRIKWYGKNDSLL